jgi:hypothetical protein
MSDRAHLTGVLLMAGAVIQMLLFIWGATRKSYLAVVLPMAAAMTTLTAIALWVGWTMLNLEEEPEEPAGDV